MSTKTVTPRESNGNKIHNRRPNPNGTPSYFKEIWKVKPCPVP